MYISNLNLLAYPNKNSNNVNFNGYVNVPAGNTRVLRKLVEKYGKYNSAALPNSKLDIESKVSQIFNVPNKFLGDVKKIVDKCVNRKNPQDFEFVVSKSEQELWSADKFPELYPVSNK